jgi:hypothetical protein
MSLVQMRLAQMVIFNVVAGMIFLRQTPEMRFVALGTWQEATSISSHYQLKMRLSDANEIARNVRAPML